MKDCQAATVLSVEEGWLEVLILITKVQCCPEQLGHRVLIQQEGRQMLLTFIGNLCVGAPQHFQRKYNQLWTGISSAVPLIRQFFFFFFKPSFKPSFTRKCVINTFLYLYNKHIPQIVFCIINQSQDSLDYKLQYVSVNRNRFRYLVKILTFVKDINGTVTDKLTFVSHFGLFNSTTLTGFAFF